MSLIENLEHETWEVFLRQAFEKTLDVLERDRFGRVGSSVDDLRSWLTCGGIANVISRLRSQMAMRGYSARKQKAIIDFVEHLARENRHKLLDLMAMGIVPAVQEELLSACGLSEVAFKDLVGRIQAGERPFEDWMRAHGRTEEEIQAVYRRIDRWLAEEAPILAPPKSASLH